MMFDENNFFRQATLKISSSLNIETAMQACMDYLQQFIPISGMFFSLYEPGLNIGRFLAYIWPGELPKPSTTIQVPEEFRQIMSDEWKNGKKIRIVNDSETAPDHFRKMLPMIWPSACSHIMMYLELENRRLGHFGIFKLGNKACFSGRWAPC